MTKMDSNVYTIKFINDYTTTEFLYLYWYWYIYKWYVYKWLNSNKKMRTCIHRYYNWIFFSNTFGLKRIHIIIIANEQYICFAPSNGDDVDLVFFFFFFFFKVQTWTYNNKE